MSGFFGALFNPIPGSLPAYILTNAVDSVSTIGTSQVGVAAIASGATYGVMEHSKC